MQPRKVGPTNLWATVVALNISVEATWESAATAAPNVIPQQRETLRAAAVAGTSAARPTGPEFFLHRVWRLRLNTNAAGVGYKNDDNGTSDSAL